MKKVLGVEIPAHGYRCAGFPKYKIGDTDKYIDYWHCDMLWLSTDIRYIDGKWRCKECFQMYCRHAKVEKHWENATPLDRFLENGFDNE